MIVYCHYPSAKQFIEDQNTEYLTYHLKINRLDSGSDTISETSPKIYYKNLNQLTSQVIKKPGSDIQVYDHDEKRNEYVKWVKETYDSMIRNSFLITNSNYSKTAILREYHRDDIIVLSPPVDVDAIISKVKSSRQYDPLDYRNENCILVICRIEPSKKIENAIYLAKLIKEKKIKAKINIVGSSEPFYQKYYNNLSKLVSDYDVSDMIEFHLDLSFDELVGLMKKSKIFFHPREGEHFGMSIVESMSAGLIPIVPVIGGQSEFVPMEYQYSSLEVALQIVSSIIEMSRENIRKESDRMIEIATEFSNANYKKHIQSIVGRLLYNEA
jgi:glycosyltransferase involved in cell wall biosynthesis